MEVQTRTDKGALRFFDDVKAAFDYAKSNKEVWKISFGGVRLVRIRLVTANNPNEEDIGWFYQPMDEIVQEAIAKAGLQNTRP